jgi:hypothetical protein
MIPIEIVNKILIYVSELNNNMMITQYHPNTNREYYIINFNSNLLWRIKSTLKMKQYYPIYSSPNYLNTKQFIELYQFGIPHYENQIRLNLIE